jgi:DNA-binding XRE family transcriptional regulator
MDASAEGSAPAAWKRTVWYKLILKSAMPLMVKIAYGSQGLLFAMRSNHEREPVGTTMKSHHVNLDGFSVAFFLEPEGEQPAELRIDFRDCSLSDWRPHSMINSTTNVSDLAVKLFCEDYFLLQDIEHLQASLLEFRNGPARPLKLQTQDGGVYLEFRRRKASEDLVIRGEIPPRHYPYHAFRATDPFLFRKGMKRCFSFEFWMAPHRLSEPIEELDALLAYLREFNGEDDYEEEPIRRQHAASPIRERPAGAINRQSFTAILALVARFKAVRETQGLTLAEVAGRIAIDPPSLSRLETGKALNPPLATLHKWAEALGRNLDVDLSSA